MGYEKQMKKTKYAILFLCMMLLCLMLCTCAQAATTQQKKIVYVVLDDSGSMSGDKWSYANYAVQVLAGLMNEGDELHLYYLNKNDVQRVDLSAAGIANSLGSISRATASGGTPFATVSKAQQAINARKVEEGAKYWLFVISDGGYAGIGDIDDVRNEFLKFVDAGIGNRHYPLEMVFCTIGSDARRIDTNSKVAAELTEKGIYCYHAEREKDIVERMGEIADRISGRSRLKGNDLKKLDSTTIEVKSDIPLFNFMVLSQNNSAKLTSVACSGGTSLRVSRTAPIKAPDPIFTKAMTANVFTVEAGKGHIPPGTYTLTFDKAVDLNNIAVLCEPALQVVLYMDDPAKVMEGSSFQVSAKILEYGTQNVYHLDQLPKGSTLELQVINGKNNLKKTGDQPAVTVSKVESGEVVVTGTLKIPGFPDIVTKEQFVPVPVPELDGHVLGNKTLKVTVEELKNNPAEKNKYIDFQITLNGKNNISKAELQAQPVSVKTTLADYELEYRDKGILRFYPKYSGGMQMGNYDVELYSNDSRFGTRKLDAGTVEVTPSTYEIKAEKETVTVKEAAFRQKNQEFRFTLFVDGKAVDAAKYSQMAVFSELTAGNPLNVRIEKGKWVAEACYVNGMLPGTYPLMVSLNGQQAQKKAELILQPSGYELNVSKKEFTFKQSELAKVKEKDFSFRVTLKEDGKQISADQVKVEGWPAAWVHTEMDAKKPNEMVVTLRGDLTADPKDHQVTVSYQSISGQVASQVVLVHILPAQFTVTLEPDKQMIFNTPDEFRNNTETYRFAVQVDGRDLTDAEMKAVTRLDTAKIAGTATDCRLDGSGYVVHPRVDAAWQTNEKLIDYSVACIVAEGDSNEVRKEARFRYHFIVYTVECFSGDGIQVVTVDLVNNTQALQFRVLADGKQMTYDEVYGNFVVNVPQNFASYVRMDTQVQPGGEIIVTPVHKDIWPLQHYRKVNIPEGQMDVTLTFNKTYTDTAQVQLLPGHWFYKWVPHVGTLLFIIWLMLMYRKKRFYRGATVYFANCEYLSKKGRITGVWEEKNMRTWPHQWISPVGKEKLRAGNIRLHAMERGWLWTRKEDRGSGVLFFHADGMEYASCPTSELPLDREVNVSVPSQFKAKKKDCDKEDEWIELSQNRAFVIRMNNEYYVLRYVSGLKNRE